MNSRCYYAYAINKNNNPFNAGSIASNEYPLIVNCAGRLVTENPFATDNVGGREDYYLLYIERGKLDVILNGCTYTAESGCAVIFPPRYRYRYTFSGESTLSYLWVHFTGSYAGRFLDECGFGELPCMLRSVPDSKISSDFEKLFHVFSVCEPLQRHKLSCRLEEILLGVASRKIGMGGARNLSKSLEYIHIYYNKDLKIPDLAKMEFLSNSRYITVFKNHMGMTPSDYIIHLRINVACDLLKNHDMSVKEVAARVGYDNPHFFGKIFKKKIGVSPKDYKENGPL